MRVAFLCGLEKATTFLVPIINPPFADNSPHLFPASKTVRFLARIPNHGQFLVERRAGATGIANHLAGAPRLRQETPCSGNRFRAGRFSRLFP